MIFRREIELRTSLIVLLTGTTLFTLLIVVSGILTFRVPQVLDENKALLLRTADDSAGRVEYFLKTLQDRIELVAHSLDAPRNFGNIRLLSRLNEQAFEASYLIDPEGIVVANAVKGLAQEESDDLNGLDLSATTLFKSARQAEGSTWSDKFLSAFSGDVTIAVATRVGDTNWTVVGELPLQGLLRISQHVEAGEIVDLWIIDGTGEIVADTGSPPATGRNLSHLPFVAKAISQQGDVFTTMSFQDSQYAMTASYSASLGWVFISRAPYGLDNPRVREVALLLIVALIASPVVGFLFAPLWAKKLTSALSQVTSHARMVAGGEASGTWPRGRITEFNELTGNLEVMSSTLAERESMLKALNEDLENRIEIRTRELDDNRSQLQTILDSSPIGIGVVFASDGEWKLMQANDGLGTIFGIDAKTLVGNTTGRYWGNPEERSASFQAALSGERIENKEVAFIRADGRPFTALLTMKRIRLSKNDAIIYWVFDITAQKNAEQDLRAALEELKRTQSSLVEAEKMASLGNLVAGVAHEINTPVGVGITAMSLLREKLSKWKSKIEEKTFTRKDMDDLMTMTEDCVNISFNNLERAAGLVRSFKRVAVDQSSERRDWFPVGGYLEEVMTSLSPQLNKARIDYAIDCDPALQMNSFQGVLAQIISNLTMNSIGHGYATDETGRIEISVEAIDDYVVLDFADDGRGMDTETKNKVFDPFFTTKRGEGGTGLGMNIVFNLVVQKLGGKITCETSPGAGAHFTITVPRETPDTSVNTA